MYLVDKYNEYKRNAREERALRDDEQAGLTVIEILSGKVGENKRNFRTTAEILYLIGEGDREDNNVNGLKRRYSRAEGSVSDVIEDLRSEDLIEIKWESGSKISELTELGNDVYDRLKPVFEDLDGVNRLENFLDSFKNKYRRNPKLTEINSKTGLGISREDMENLSSYWKAPEDDEIPTFFIVAGYVISNTSAEGISGVNENNGRLSIAFSNGYDGGDKEIREYAEKNRGFLEGLELENLSENVFSLELDDFTNFITTEESITFEILQTKDIKKELKEIAG